MEANTIMQKLDTQDQQIPALAWELTGLQPDPWEEWQRLVKFLDFNADDRRAMLETVEPLFRRGH